jgi:hypothetical protein
MQKASQMKDKRQIMRYNIIIFYVKYIIRFYQFFHHKLIPLLKEENSPKVFCIGYVKTGTTSLYKALSILDYRTVQMLRGCVKPKEGWVEYIKKCKYDAYLDYPFFLSNLFKQIDKEFPNCKFILTIRDDDSWEKSYANFYHITSDKSKKEGKKGYNEHNKEVIKYFKKKPSQLLIMNIIDGDGWDKLCKFLDKPIPKKPFPHKNKGRYKRLYYTKSQE